MSSPSLPLRDEMSLLSMVKVATERGTPPRSTYQHDVMTTWRQHHHLNRIQVFQTYSGAPPLEILAICYSPCSAPQIGCEEISLCPLGLVLSALIYFCCSDLLLFKFFCLLLSGEAVLISFAGLFRLTLHFCSVCMFLQMCILVYSVHISPSGIAHAQAYIVSRAYDFIHSGLSLRLSRAVTFSCD